MNRIGHESKPNSATNPTSSPELMLPFDTRHAPTASNSAVASVGSASRPASKVARR